MDLGRFVTKIIFGLAAFTLIGSTILFSAWGNRLLQPLVESALSRALSSPVTLRTFFLDPTSYSLLLQDSSGNRLFFTGHYSLFTLQTQGRYFLNFPYKHGINPLGTPLKSSGIVTGGYGRLHVQGSLDAYLGSALYQSTLFHFSPDVLKLTFRNLDAQTLLRDFDYPSDTQSHFDGKVELYGFHDRTIGGNITLKSTTHTFSPTPIRDEETNTSFNLKEWLSNENGEVKPFKINVNTTLSFDQIGIIEQPLTLPLRGPLFLSSHLHGDENLLFLDTRSALSRGNLTATLIYRELQPNHITLNASDVQASALFHLFNKEAPISGRLNLQGEFGPLEGALHISLRHGKTMPDVLKHQYDITQPPLAFNADIHARLSSKDVHYQASLHSNLARMEIDNTTTHDQMLAELLRSIP